MVSETLERLVRKDSFRIVVAHGEQRVYHHAVERLRDEGFSVSERNLPIIHEAVKLLQDTPPAQLPHVLGQEPMKTLITCAKDTVIKFAQELDAAGMEFLLTNTADEGYYNFFHNGLMVAMINGRLKPAKLYWHDVEDYDLLLKHVDSSRVAHLIYVDRDDVYAKLTFTNADRAGTIIPGYQEVLKTLQILINDDMKGDIAPRLRSKMEECYADIAFARREFGNQKRNPLYEELAFRISNAYSILFGTDILTPSSHANGTSRTSSLNMPDVDKRRTFEDTLKEMGTKLRARRYGDRLHNPHVVVMAQEKAMYGLYMLNLETSKTADGHGVLDVVVNHEADLITRHELEQYVNAVLQTDIACVMVVDDMQPNTFSKAEKITYGCHMLAQAKHAAEKKRRQQLH